MLNVKVLLTMIGHVLPGVEMAHILRSLHDHLVRDA